MRDCEGGKIKETSDDGVLIWERDELDGEKILYYPTGKVHARSPIVNGREIGPVVMFYETGEKKADGYVIDGFLTGKMKVYSLQGDVISEGYYIKHKKVSKKKYINEQAKHAEWPIPEEWP